MSHGIQQKPFCAARPAAASGLALTDETFAQLRTLIYEQSGIHFADSKKYILEGRLQTRLRERRCGSFEDYYHLLKYDAWRDKELTELFNLITTNETFFFRDQPQLQAFTQTIVPTVLQANRSEMRLRIWSAACSTGDEPYTLAMLLLEMPALAKWTIEIVGTDISETALAQAREAVYGSYAVRNVPPPLLRKYFAAVDGRYALAEQVKRMVKFLNLNLYDAARIKLIRGMDAIFCRNCLIYFDDKAKERIVANLADALKPQGYLVIGFSESLHQAAPRLKRIHASRSVIYQKA